GAYRRVGAIDPTYAAAWNNLGLLLHRMGRHDEPHRAYTAALKQDERGWGAALLAPAAGPVARLRRCALQPCRGAGAPGPRRGCRRALAALPGARRRQPGGPDRGRASRGPGAARGAARVRVLVVGGGGREHALA